jgi:hypothetical protein
MGQIHERGDVPWIHLGGLPKLGDGFLQLSLLLQGSPALIVSDRLF